MQATIIEAPDVLAEMGLVIPEDHLDACRVLGMPTSGNAAGNKGLDMDGVIDQVPAVNDGALVVEKK
jgi:iron transport multicopper oxidase